MAISAVTALVGAGTAAVAGTLGTFTLLGSAFLGTFAINFALGVALNALSPKPKNNSGANGGYTVNSRGSALDHQIIYGKSKVGGAIVYDEATGTNNKFLHRIIAVAGHEVESFDRLYINESYIDFGDIDPDGNIPSVVNPDGSVSTRFNDKVRVQFAYGTSAQAANTDLVAESSHWTPSHKLSGIAYMYVRLKFDADTFPNGVPTFTAEVKGKKVYNPSTGLTAWSDNPALCLRDYLTAPYGLEEASANIDDDLVIAAAAVCDQTDTIATTTRYTCNGAFTTAVTPFNFLSEVLSSMGGSLWYAQGKWRMKPSYWTSSVMSLDEDDFRSSINVSTRHSRRDNFNTCLLYTSDAADE